jgi:hypothetical protein
VLILIVNPQVLNLPFFTNPLKLKSDFSLKKFLIFLFLSRPSPLNFKMLGKKAPVWQNLAGIFFF